MANDLVGKAGDLVGFSGGSGSSLGGINISLITAVLFVGHV